MRLSHIKFVRGTVCTFKIGNEHYTKVLNVLRYYSLIRNYKRDFGVNRAVELQQVMKFCLMIMEDCLNDDEIKIRKMK